MPLKYTDLLSHDSQIVKPNRKRQIEVFAKECGHFHLRILDAFVCLPATLVLSFLELVFFSFTY